MFNTQVSQWAFPLVLVLTSLGIEGCVTSGSKKTEEGVASSPGVIRHSFVLPLGGTAAVWNGNEGGSLPEVFSLLEKGDLEGAERTARAQLAKSPADPQAFLALSASLLMSRKIELANYYATRLATLQPDAPAVEQSSAKNIQGIAKMLFAVGSTRNEDFDDAATIFRDALSASGTQVAAALNLGELELMRGRPTESLAAFGQASERCNECRPALYGAGIASLRARQFDRARNEFKQLVKRNDKDDEAHYQLAVTEYYGFQDVDGASRRLKDLATGGTDTRVRAMAESLLRKLRASK
jgi:tetratricopeptide (TPR) repeat protein